MTATVLIVLICIAIALVAEYNVAHSRKAKREKTKGHS
jgi:hypothetical protein